MRRLLVVIALLTFITPSPTAEPPSADAVVAALSKATAYMHGTIAKDGGYLWVASPDGKFGNGEGAAGPGTIWVQPPGTPAVGMAFLDAYEATGDTAHLHAARDAAHALVKGQLTTGGWYYRVEHDPAKRREFDYREGRAAPTKATPQPGGWDVWKQRRNSKAITILDDDTTPAALRFLMRTDKAFGFEDAAIHDAVDYALASTRNAQHPIGAWSHNYDHYQTEPPAVVYYPVLRATFPENWSRTWTKDFTGGYTLNDRTTQNMIATMLLAHRIYGKPEYRESAERGGEFLRLAQLPDPQPAWAQQYDRKMQPVWDRKFEPPAITGLESQDVLETLLHLYRETGERKFLEPIPAALAYLKKSELGDGTIARFYELRTNRPLYFTKDYRITYDRGQMPSHYGFVFPSRLAKIEKEYNRIQALDASQLREDGPPKRTKELEESVAKILAAQDARGGWTEPGFTRDAAGRKVTPADGVVNSQTFIDNVTRLCEYLRAARN